MTLPPRTLVDPRIDGRKILDSLGVALPPPSQPPALVMMVGLPGAGKSTLSRRLAPALGAVILESDALRRLLFHPPSHSKRESRALFPAIHAAMADLLTRGISVILDATNLKESDRQPVQELSARTRARLLVIDVTASRQVIEQRLYERELRNGPNGPEAGLEAYRRLARTAQLPTGSWTVDTSDEATYETAAGEFLRQAAHPVLPGRGES